jgi:2-phosphosulfolactate phosphatase
MVDKFEKHDIFGDLVVYLTILNTHFKLPISCRQFEGGVIESASEQGITVIVDNFRASNTILALLDVNAEVVPVETTEEAVRYDGFIKIGEEKRDFSKFDYDNSPMFIVDNPDIFKNKSVVIRTTNGTRGIKHAIGSKEILIGSFRNLTRVVEYCKRQVKKGIPVSFIAMGSLDISRIEDVYGAKMMYYKLIEIVGSVDEIEREVNSDDNPWNRDWKSEIIEHRPVSGRDGPDRMYSMQLDASDILPKYSIETGKLVKID